MICMFTSPPCLQFYLPLVDSIISPLLTALPAAEVHLARHDSAETLPAGRAPSDVTLHLSVPNLRLQAPLVRRAGRWTAGSSGGPACGELCGSPAVLSASSVGMTTYK